MNQVRWEISAAAGASDCGAAARAGEVGVFCLPAFCLRLRDFVEAVPTYFSHYLKFRKKLLVNIQNIPFKRTDDDIRNAVFPKNRSSIRSAGIHAPDLRFARGILESMGPDMSGITQQRFS